MPTKKRAKAKKRGRPPALTPALHDALVKVTEEGLPRKTVAALCGIGHSTFKAYLALGREQKKGPYRALFNAVEQAEAKAERRSGLLVQKAASGGIVVEERTIRRKGKDGDPDEVETIKKFATPQWTAAAWWLERRWPERYARRDRVGVDAKGKDLKSYQLIVVEGPDEIPPPSDLPRE